MAMMMCFDLIKHNAQLPRTLTGLSPWVELLPVNKRPSHFENDDVDIVTTEVLDDWALEYLGPDVDQGFASPSHQSTEYLAKLPPTQLQAGDKEVMRDDVLNMASRISEAGGTVETIIEPNMLHSWFVVYRFGLHDSESNNSVCHWARWISMHSTSSL